jgi:hypothetical protein
LSAKADLGADIRMFPAVAGAMSVRRIAHARDVQGMGAAASIKTSSIVGAGASIAVTGRGIAL